MIETCLYKNPTGRYLDIRLDRIQLCGYDRCAAALMNVFSRWTDYKLGDLRQRRVEGKDKPWVFLSKRQLRQDLLGVFGEPSIERGISVLKSLGVLSEREPEHIGLATWYLFDYETANRLLKEVIETTELPSNKCPKRRNGWTAQQASFGNNAEGQQCLSAFGNNADVPSAIMPTNRNLKQESEKQEEPLTPFCPESPRLDPETGEEIQSPKKYSRFQSRKKEPKLTPNSDRLRAMRESAHANAGSGVAALLPVRTTETAIHAPSINFPDLWNEAVPDKPVDPSLLAPNPKPYRDSGFASRFSEICQKAKSLIAAGADLEFGFLLSIDRATEQYRWQQLLAGQLEWMRPRGKNGKPKDDFVDRMKKEFGL